MANSKWFAYGCALLAILLASIYPYIASRLLSLSVLLSNSPGQLKEFKAFSNYQVKFRNELRNCEDGLLVEGEEGLAILSCDSGRDLWNTVMGVFTQPLSSIPSGELFIYRYQTFRRQNETLSRIRLLDFHDASGFHPLGIEYHKASRQLFVCNHHFEGPRVEIFTLDDLNSPSPTARHRRTITSPLIHSPNAIVALNEGEIYVTNDHFFQIRHHRLLARLETYAGLPSGSIVHIDLQTDDPSEAAIQSVARVPFANGITLLNSSVLAVASTNACQVRLYTILPSSRKLELSYKINIPFMPDNLSTDSRGALLIAGHPHPPSLDSLVESRRVCLKDPSLLNECHNGSAPSWVAEWTEDSGLRTLYRTIGEFGTSSTALRDTNSNLGLVTGLYEKGIMVWRE